MLFLNVCLSILNLDLADDQVVALLCDWLHANLVKCLLVDTCLDQYLHVLEPMTFIVVMKVLEDTHLSDHLSDDVLGADVLFPQGVLRPQLNWDNWAVLAIIQAHALGRLIAEVARCCQHTWLESHMLFEDLLHLGILFKLEANLSQLIRSCKPEVNSDVICFTCDRDLSLDDDFVLSMMLELLGELVSRVALPCSVMLIMIFVVLVDCLLEFGSIVGPDQECWDVD